MNNDMKTLIILLTLLILSSCSLENRNIKCWINHTLYTHPKIVTHFLYTFLHEST